MASSSSPFDASASAQGYLYQCRCALLLALQRAEEPGLGISIEKVDDVAFHPLNTPQTATELRQFKLHTSRQGNLGDKSADIWKTIRVWAEAVQSKRIDLDRVTLCLVTTASASNQNAVRYLLPNPAQRKPEEAWKLLTQAGAASASQDVKKAMTALGKLTVDEQKKLFAAAYLLEDSLDPTTLQREIGRCLWPATLPEHRQAFVERLEGWWVHLVVQHLQNPSPPPIPLDMVRQQVHEIRMQFRRERLPDDLFNEPVPADQTEPGDERTFVKQLNLLGLSPERLRFAQEDHYRAFTQRSRWVSQQLMVLDEATNYETRLIDGWKERFTIMREGLPPNCDGQTSALHGLKLYDWIVLDAPSKGCLWVRPEFQAEYMVKGSYHMLADLLRVGWHPHYETHLRPAPAPTQATAGPTKPAGAKKPAGSRRKAKP
jgi:hypothetical protein